MRLLPNVVWNFTGESYETPEAFNEAVTRYQQEIVGEGANWNPREVLIEHPQVDIIYECWPEKTEPLSANETLIEAYDDGDYEEREVSVRFVADDDRAFTALELLYKLHQHLRNKALVDHSFFEGLSPADEQQQSPLFHLYCGS